MSRTQFFLCLLGISAVLVNNVEAYRVRRIVGGSDARDGQFLYQVSLELDGESICGGSILSERFVITAAHCVIDVDNSFMGEPLKVVAGFTDLASTSRVAVDVAKVFVPEDYDARKEIHTSRSTGDIAILELSEDLDLKDNSKLGQVQLPKKDETYEGKKANVSGFGSNYVDLVKDPSNGKLVEVNDTTYGRMRHAEANVLSYDDCQHIFSPLLPIEKTHLCAALAQHNLKEPEGVCNGDSGGPLVHEGAQIGVISIGPQGCRENRIPANHTRVSDYVDFINDVVEEIVYYDTCDLSGPFWHGVKLAPERSEESCKSLIVYRTEPLNKLLQVFHARDSIVIRTMTIDVSHSSGNTYEIDSQSTMKLHCYLTM